MSRNSCLFPELDGLQEPILISWIIVACRDIWCLPTSTGNRFDFIHRYTHYLLDYKSHIDNHLVWLFLLSNTQKSDTELTYHTRINCISFNYIWSLKANMIYWLRSLALFWSICHMVVRLNYSRQFSTYLPRCLWSVSRSLTALESSV